VRDPERFLALREPWERLRARVPGFTLFQSHAWLRTWWEHLADSEGLFVVCRWEGDELAAAAPLCLARSGAGPLGGRTLRFMAAERSDFCRFLVPAGDEQQAADLWGALQAAGMGWTLADLRYVPDGGVGLPAGVTLPGARHIRQEQERNRWVEFTGAAWRQQVKKPMRHNVERQRRRLEAQGPLAFEHAEDEQSARAFLDELAEMHGPLWAARGEVSVYASRRHRAWAHAVAQRALADGTLYLCRLRQGARTIVMGWAFVENGHLLLRQYAYDMAFAPYSPAGVLVGEILEDVQTRGIASVLDFGRGDEEYKTRWTNNERTLYRHVLIPRGIRGAVHGAMACRVMPFIWQHQGLGRVARGLKRRLSP